MTIPPHNEIILNGMYSIYKDAITNGLPLSRMVFNDQDNSKYSLTYSNDAHKFLFSFYAMKFDEVFAIDGKNVLSTYYPDFTVENPESGFNLTLSIDCKSIPRYGDKDDKEKKAAIKQAEETFFNKYSGELSLFKRNLFASPYLKIFKTYVAGKPETQPFSYCPSDNERVFIIPKPDQCVVFLALGFNEGDETVAKFILIELEDSKKHVKNPPLVQKMHDDKIPELLKANFPSFQLDMKKYTNGIFGITMFKDHILNNFENASTSLCQVRQYLKYHIHSIKSYMHGRIRKRVAELQKLNNQAKFEEEGKKTYRSMKGKNVEVNLKGEPEKSGPVINKSKA